MMRDKFLSELAEFNENFDFPKEKLEELFDSAMKDTKLKSKTSSKSSLIYYKK